MPIMCCRNKFVQLCMWLLLAWGNNVFAGFDTEWVSSQGGQVQLEMSDGSVYRLKSPPSVVGVFYDRNGHEVGSGIYISVFQVSPSNSANATGYCGAGNEVWLYVYEVLADELHERDRVLVSSCLHSISMPSQNTGAPTQETDFSSVQWTEEGFYIEWFNNVDAQGRSLSSTRYVLRDGVFLPSNVVGKERQDK